MEDRAHPGRLRGAGHARLVACAAVLVAAVDPVARAPLVLWAAAAALAVTRQALAALTGAAVPPDVGLRVQADRGLRDLGCYLQRHAEFAAYLDRRRGERKARPGSSGWDEARARMPRGGSEHDISQPY